MGAEQSAEAVDESQPQNKAAQKQGNEQQQDDTLSPPTSPPMTRSETGRSDGGNSEDSVMQTPAPVGFGLRTYLFDEPGSLGLHLEMKSSGPKKQDLVINHVAPSLQADQAGIPEGGIITAINGKALKPSDIWAALSSGQARERPLSLSVYVPPPDQPVSESRRGSISHRAYKALTSPFVA